MTMPKGWKPQLESTAKPAESTAKTAESTAKPAESTAKTAESTAKQKGSIITKDDRLSIEELIAKYNHAIDSKNIDEWMDTWTIDGLWSTPFGKAKGKDELKNMINQITTAFASGKRHLSTNVIIEGELNNNNTAKVKSYLTVIEARNRPAVVASGVYSDVMKKNEKDEWKFVQRNLEIDLVHE